jgi:XTP/dITP diphosphohydrolase
VIERLVVATTNRDKLGEIEAVLLESGIASETVPDLEWPEIKETGDTLEENALLKARAVAAWTGLPAVADDTGLEVAALGGAPGVRTARYAGPAATYASNRAALLAALAGVAQRDAIFRTVVALVWPEGREVTAEGRLEGTITVEERGDQGFGYDPVFEVKGRTLAEWGTEAKNRFSHRAAALRVLAELLRAGQF